MGNQPPQPLALQLLLIVFFPTVQLFKMFYCVLVSQSFSHNDKVVCVDDDGVC